MNCLQRRCTSFSFLWNTRKLANKSEAWYESKLYILVCKPERETPLFHLGKNFGPFRRVLVIPANFGQYGHFGRFTFSRKLSSLQRSSSPPAPPHLQPARLQLLPRRPGQFLIFQTASQSLLPWWRLHPLQCILNNFP
jgi:hypothetical protein